MSEQLNYSILTFSIKELKALMQHAKDNPGDKGYKYPYENKHTDVPMLWLVGDEGVYFMTAGKRNDENIIVYAQECNPKTNPDCYENKRNSWGGDDGAEAFLIDEIEKVIGDEDDDELLGIKFFENGTLHLALNSTWTSITKK